MNLFISFFVFRKLEQSLLRWNFGKFCCGYYSSYTITPYVIHIILHVLLVLNIWKEDVNYVIFNEIIFWKRIFVFKRQSCTFFVEGRGNIPQNCQKLKNGFDLCKFIIIECCVSGIKYRFSFFLYVIIFHCLIILNPVKLLL